MRDKIDDLILEKIKEFVKAMLTSAEILQYHRMKALGLIKPKEKTFSKKALEELSKKLPINQN